MSLIAQLVLPTFVASAGCGDTPVDPSTSAPTLLKQNRYCRTARSKGSKGRGDKGTTYNFFTDVSSLEDCKKKCLASDTKCFGIEYGPKSCEVWLETPYQVSSSYGSFFSCYVTTWGSTRVRRTLSGGSGLISFTDVIGTTQSSLPQS